MTCLGLLWESIVSLPSAAAADLSKAEAQVKAIEQKLGGRLGVALLDTGNGQRLEHRALSAFRCAAPSSFLPLPPFFIGLT